MDIAKPREPPSCPLRRHPIERGQHERDSHRTQLLARLLPYAANARLHFDEPVSLMAASIAAFGFNVP